MNENVQPVKEETKRYESFGKYLRKDTASGQVALGFEPSLVKFYRNHLANQCTNSIELSAVGVKPDSKTNTVSNQFILVLGYVHYFGPEHSWFQRVLQRTLPCKFSQRRPNSTLTQVTVLSRVPYYTLLAYYKIQASLKAQLNLYIRCRQHLFGSQKWEGVKLLSATGESLITSFPVEPSPWDLQSLGQVSVKVTREFSALIPYPSIRS